MLATPIPYQDASSQERYSFLQPPMFSSSAEKGFSSSLESTSIRSNWTSSGQMASMPWGAQAQNRKGARSTTPNLGYSEHDSASTTMIACSNSTSSLDKQVIQDAIPLSQPLQRFGTASTLETPGAPQTRVLTRSTDSFELFDSPSITPMHFPTPPEKPSYSLAQYQSSQVTPPAHRPVTPEPVEPRTPTLVSPDTGRFDNTVRSYPSPVQAGFRTPSSRYSAETSGRRDVSASSFKAARALNFDIQYSPIVTVPSNDQRPRTDSFGASAIGEGYSASRSTAARMPDIRESLQRSPSRYINYGFDMIESPAIDLGDVVSEEPAKEGRVYGFAESRGFAPHLTPSNDTPNLSISGLVSSPPSVDSGVDYNTVHTTVVTPEDRNFPNIGSPQRENWTSPGVIGLVDVYTNDNSGKPKTGFKEKFSQSMLNLLGDTKKTKRQQADGNVDPETSQWPRKMTKKEKRKSVTDLLGPSVPRTTYDWNQPKPVQSETPGAKARSSLFKRSESTPAQLAMMADPRCTGPSSSLDPALSKRSRFFPSRNARMEPRSLPISPSMPALSASMRQQSASDLRIQTWLNASQAALLETQTGRYDFGRAALQEQPRAGPTALKQYSFSSTHLPRMRKPTEDGQTEVRASAALQKSGVAGQEAMPPVACAAVSTRRRASEEADETRTSSISKLASWLGIRRGVSKKASGLREEVGGKSVVAPVAQLAASRSDIPAGLAPSRKTASFANLHQILSPSTAEDRAEKQSRRRSGGDCENLTSCFSALSISHRPTINEHGFLQFSAPFHGSARFTITPSASHWSIAQSIESTETYPAPEPAFAAPGMERDLSRLTEREEEDTGRQDYHALPTTTTRKPVPVTQSYRKPLPAAPTESLGTSPQSLSVPAFEHTRRHSGRLDRRVQGLSIGSLSSMSTAITDGEEHRAIIRTVLASPIHVDTPSGAAPVVARGVSMDLNALTPEERRAVGFGPVDRHPVPN
ncbi:hypothetical protein QFC20_004156 [Naganishia adeliensis]|uniref:Uncharacterized protein n=1 Tax=Naganishia adeliensis TaxID=92952 RepID=A0ACC2W3D9_9TREE|nr:hypothetical protein QFC20_004156 [Naganishia adeliensis]